MTLATAKMRTGRARPERKPSTLAVSLPALQLLGRWQRVCKGHLSFTNGCACGFDASVDLADLDDLVVDYLQRRFEGVAAVARFLAEHGVPEGAATGGIKNLLRALAVAAGGLAPAEAHELLKAIEASIVSIEERHAI